jgi:hypothetical protein
MVTKNNMPNSVIDVTFRFANGVDMVEFDIARDDNMEQMLIELKKLIDIARK